MNVSRSGIGSDEKVCPPEILTIRKTGNHFSSLEVYFIEDSIENNSN